MPPMTPERLNEIERLRVEVDNLTDDISRALQTLAAENEENERLRARLEVDDSGYDGISCRDETIKNQDAIIDGRRARVAELEAAQAWRPIESAPRDGTHVLARDVPLGIRITNLTHPPMVVHWFDYIGDAASSGWYLSHGAGDGPAVSPTHWMPLPAPPKAGT